MPGSWRKLNCKEADALTFGNKKGLRLQENREKGSWLLPAGVALVASVAMTLGFSELTGFRESLTMGLTAGYLCLLYGLMTRLQKQTWFFPGVLLVLAGVVFLCQREVMAGFCQFQSRLGQTLARGTGWVLPELIPPQGAKTWAGSLFAGLCGGAMALAVCFFTLHAPQALAVLLTGGTLVGMWFTGREENLGFLIPILGASLALLLYGGWGKKTAAAPRALSWGICGALAALVLTIGSVTGVGTWASQVSDQARRAVHGLRYETKYTTLPEGDFRQTPENQTQALPALLVTMSDPGELYLRGFAGCTFEEDVWKPMDSACLGENRALLYWLNQTQFYLNAQFSQAASVLEPETGTVAIENVGACSENLYIPLGLTAGSWLEAENLNQDTLSGHESRSYQYTVVKGDGEAIARVLENLQNSDEAEVLRYRKGESAYRDFVWDNYTQVPDQVTQLLGARWDAIGERYGSRDNLTLRQAQECVLTFLEACFSGDAGEQTLPLEKAQGTSYQYATVAVLTLRYFGIPARYAEGYVISREMAQRAVAGQALEVTSSCAAGWPEVYQDGIGWIPMALAPGFGEMLQKEPQGSQGTDKTQEEGEETTPQETQENQKEPEAIGGSVTALATGSLWTLVLILGALALCWLLLVLRRNILRRRKERLFRRELGAEAVCWLFADAALLLEQLGFSRGNGSMEPLCRPLEERFGGAYARRLEAMICCNQQALFSSHPMTDGQWQEMKAFHQDTVALLRTQSKWYRRFWMKWIRCLY